MTASRRLARALLPADFIRVVRSYVGRGIRFSGSYATWRDAAQRASGYDAEEILDRVRRATEEARQSGGRKLERDGMVIDNVDPPLSLVAGLLRAATESRLCVFDFGGSLGSSYRQCRPGLASVERMQWVVIEQPHFVALGKSYADDVLSFAETLEEAASTRRPDAILFSGVLQYLEAPMKVVAGAIGIGPQSIIIDRTPTIGLEASRIAVQEVPGRLGASSYPVWLFNRDHLLEPFAGRYRCVEEFDALDGVMSYRSRRVEFKGFILEKLSKPGAPR